MPRPGLRVLAGRPSPALLTLPWAVPLADWQDHVVPLPRGLSRHVVRIVRLDGATYAVKETQEPIAFREYHLLRDLQRLDLPTVVPVGVVSGRVDDAGAPLPAVLVTRHLAFSLPYRHLVAQGMAADSVPALVDAIVVLLVRLHLAGFYWGDVSLSNVLFRRDAGGFAAYLVDAETGELRDSVSDALRAHELSVAAENIYAELLDVAASVPHQEAPDPDVVVTMLGERYDALWTELTGAQTVDTDELWRIEQRIERLNDLGFDVEELDLVTDLDGDHLEIRPRVVEAGHHRRELRGLTGLDVQDAQARRLLNDIAAFTTALDLGREDRHVVASRWLDQVWEPLQALVPPEARGKLEPAEVFHEVLVHRWYLSERAGHEVDLFETARDYVARFLPARPDEAITALGGLPDDDDPPG